MNRRKREREERNKRDGENKRKLLGPKPHYEDFFLLVNWGFTKR
jgi:hypothetical protein